MSLQRFQGFELETDTNSMLRLYGAGNFTLGSGALLNQSGALLQGVYFKGGTGISTMNMSVAPDGTFYAGIRVRARNPVNSLKLFRFLNSTTEHFSLRFVTTGLGNNYRLALFNAAGTEVSGANTGTLTGDDGAGNSPWYFVEIRGTVHDTVGTYEIRVNETTVPGATGTADLRNGGTTTVDRVEVNIQHLGVGSDRCDIDDVVIINSLAGDRTTFAGDVAEVKAVHDSDEGAHLSATNNWTPSSGTSHFDMIDDVTPDDDATYLTTNENEKTELFNVADLAFAAIGTPVIGVRQELMLKLLSPGTRNTQFLYKSGVTTNPSATIPFNQTTYETKERTMERDPVTNAAWTVAEINASKFGFKTVA